ncbi:MAG: hypothetical protein IJ194_02705 [Bacilli bacterium]|nr:hypothetical protein [Bacilli bacterium]
MNVLIKMNENEVKVYAQEHHISIQEAYRALMLKNLEESYESHVEEEMLLTASYSSLTTARI